MFIEFTLILPILYLYILYYIYIMVLYFGKYKGAYTNSCILFQITYVKELYTDEKSWHMILIGCTFKSSGILFVCHLPTLTTIRCIDLPYMV